MILALTCIALALLIIVVRTKTWNVSIYFLLFFWGFQDSGINTLINTILGFEFESKTTPFAVYKMS